MIEIYDDQRNFWMWLGKMHMDKKFVADKNLRAQNEGI
jgi:hypothetical protein